MPELVERLIPFITASLLGLLGFAIGSASVSDPYWAVERQLETVTATVDETVTRTAAVKRSSRDQLMEYQPKPAAPRPQPVAAPRPVATGPAVYEFEGPDYKFLVQDENFISYTWRLRAKNVGGPDQYKSIRVSLRGTDGKRLESEYPRLNLGPGQSWTYRGIFVVHRLGPKVARVTLDDCSAGQCKD